MSPFAPPTSGRHRAPSAPTAARRLGRAAVATLAAGAPLAGLGLAAPAAHAETDWDKLAQCESSGNWATNTGNGFSGGLQFTPSTWTSFGGTGKPENASREEQIAVAEKVKQAQGMTAWPVCSKKTGQTSNAANSSVPRSTSSGSDDDQSDKSGKNDDTESSDGGKTQVAAAHTDAPRKAPRPAPSGGDYTVRQGDTLSSIATSHGMTWKQLQDANTSVISDPDMILPGWTLTTG